MEGLFHFRRASHPLPGLLSARALLQLGSLQKSTVISVDYFKRIIADWRNTVEGRVTTYESRQLNSLFLSRKPTAQNFFELQECCVFALVQGNFFCNLLVQGSTERFPSFP